MSDETPNPILLTEVSKIFNPEFAQVVLPNVSDLNHRSEWEGSWINNGITVSILCILVVSQPLLPRFTFNLAGDNAQLS